MPHFIAPIITKLGRYPDSELCIADGRFPKASITNLSRYSESMTLLMLVVTAFFYEICEAACAEAKLFSQRYQTLKSCILVGIAVGQRRRLG